MKINKVFFLGFFSAIMALESCGNKDEKADDKSVEKDSVSFCECAGLDYGVTTEAGLLKKYGEDVLKECDKYLADDDFEDKARKCPDLKEVFDNLDEIESMMDGVDPDLPPAIPGDVDCDKLIAEYESFLKEYLELVKVLKVNPKDVDGLKRYSNLSIKAGSFMNDAIVCSMDPEYADKIEKMSKELEEASAGL